MGIRASHCEADGRAWRGNREAIDGPAARCSRLCCVRGGRCGLTLVELLVVIGIIGLLAGLGLINYQAAQLRARVASTRNLLRTVGGAVEVYRVDHTAYPTPRQTSGDPLGILATSSLNCLTSPIAYIGPELLHDQFGMLRGQDSAGLALAVDDPFRPPEPGFNSEMSLMYIHYPTFAAIVGKPEMNKSGYNVISIGPDLRDSLITYLPFPSSLPSTASRYGISQAIDTVYDPTNGSVSGGDLAWFGGEVGGARLVGGGN